MVQTFKTTFSKLSEIAARGGLGIFTAAVSSMGPWGFAIFVISVSLVAQYNADQFLDDYAEWITTDLEELGYSRDDAERLAEDFSDQLDHLVFLGPPTVFNHYRELINEKRNCWVESKQRREDSKSIIDKNNQDKSRMNTPPNGNHGQDCIFIPGTPTYVEGFLPDGTPTLIVNVPSGSWYCR